MTFHDKIMHIAPTTDFELRQPLSTTTLNCYSCKLKVSSLCSHGDMSKNTPRSPVLKFCKKSNETLLRMLHTDVHILSVYAKYMAPPTKSMSYMAAKTQAAANVSMEKNEKTNVSKNH